MLPISSHRAIVVLCTNRHVLSTWLLRMLHGLTIQADHLLTIHLHLSLLGEHVGCPWLLPSVLQLLHALVARDLLSLDGVGALGLLCLLLHLLLSLLLLMLLLLLGKPSLHNSLLMLVELLSLLSESCLGSQVLLVSLPTDFLRREQLPLWVRIRLSLALRCCASRFGDLPGLLLPFLGNLSAAINDPKITRTFPLLDSVRGQLSALQLAWRRAILLSLLLQKRHLCLISPFCRLRANLQPLEPCFEVGSLAHFHRQRFQFHPALEALPRCPPIVRALV